MQIDNLHSFIIAYREALALSRLTYNQSVILITIYKNISPYSLPGRGFTTASVNLALKALRDKRLLDKDNAITKHGVSIAEYTLHETLKLTKQWNKNNELD